MQHTWSVSVGGRIMAMALEAFCLMMFQWSEFRAVERQKPRS